LSCYVIREALQNHIERVVVAQRGSHVQLKHPDRRGRVTIPIHAGETIGPRLLASVLSQAGLSVEEFRSAL